MAVLENNKLFELGERNFQQSLYEFSHLNKKEFALKLGANRIEETIKRRKRATYFNDISECENLPESINWVEMGKVSPAKDQQSCGCCYIFSGSTTLESAIAIEYGTNPLRLSQQHILECISNISGIENPCLGGKFCLFVTSLN